MFLSRLRPRKGASPDAPQATEHEPGATKAKPPSFRSDALQLYVLSAFAIAQPLLDRLAGRVIFLIQEQIRREAILLVVAAVMLAVPSALVLIEWLAGRMAGFSARRWTHRCFVFVLLFCLLLFAIKTLLVATDWKTLGIPGFLIVAVGGIVSYFLTRLLDRSSAARKVVSYASVGLVLFPAVFLFKGGVRDIILPPTATSSVRIEKPVPIVMVVFDGFSGMALMDENHQIDAARYPNFARLAKTSHWYRNATTVHPRTWYALPAILTGQMPRDVEPTPSEYPQNLFQLVFDSKQYEMSIFEPCTKLAPLEIKRHATPRSTIEQAGYVLKHLSYVYLHATVPADLPPGLPDIPRTWFNLPEQSVSARNQTTGVFAHAWDENRPGQFAHFLNCLEPSEKPGFRFLHLVIPHHPWNYLPSGICYAPEMRVGDFPLGAHGTTGEQWTTDPLVVNLAWQRYLLQIQYVDGQIGQLLDRLESTGQLDECLLVVTADHGESYIPGMSRRDPVGENLPDILPVPLFIKLPGQTTGEVSDRNVECIDITPTIADVIGVELEQPVDGRAIFSSEDHPSLRKTFFVDWEPLAVEADFPERYRYVERMIEQFGTGSHEDRLTTYSLMPELVGRSLDEFNIDDSAGPDVSLYYGSGRVEASQPDVVRCLIEGQVAGASAGSPPLTLVISLNGEITAVTRTIQDEVLPGAFTVLVPASAYHTGDNELRIFELRATTGGQSLFPCEFTERDPGR